MSHIRMRREHTLTRADARARVEKIARELKRKFDTDYAWNEDSLQFARPGATGTIMVGEDSLDIEVKLSFFLAPMRGKIEVAIQEQLEAALVEDPGYVKPA